MIYEENRLSVVCFFFYSNFESHADLVNRKVTWRLEEPAVAGLRLSWSKVKSARLKFIRSIQLVDEEGMVSLSHIVRQNCTIRRRNS